MLGLCQNCQKTLQSKETKNNGSVLFNPLSTNSDENEISLYVITTCSNIQAMRIKQVVSKDEMS